MTQPLLSILIPTVVGREQELGRLRSKLVGMARAIPRGTLEAIVAGDNKQITIGEKRENLYARANGLYAWQLDDDDDIAADCLPDILDAALQNPDCITFQEHCDINGAVLRSNHSLAYPEWRGDGTGVLEDGFHFWRTPFFKNVIRTEIARSVPIPRIRYYEDIRWAEALKPVLRTEAHIARDIYFYQHRSTEFNARYGMDPKKT